jgi:glycosyltransferase involved in cell wall biosynthesis
MHITPPRILFLTQSHNVWGGMEQWLHNFTLWLQENTSFDVRVALPRGRQFNDPDAYLRAHSHMRPIVLDVRVGTPTIRVRRIVEAIESFDADLIVPIATGDVFEAVAEAKRRGSKVRFLQPVRALVAELCANILDFWPAIDGVVSISRLFHRFFEENLASDLERVHYVRHGARPAFVPHDRTAIEDPSSPLRIAYVGRIEPGAKRILELIPLMEHLGRLQANVELHFYGEGPAEDELRARLKERAVFHGYQSQDALYRDAYPRIDVVLLVSDGEGTPNAVVEGMQHGCVPVISRYHGQAGERFVVHGQNGFTFPLDAVETAAEEIARLARDRQLLGEMSARAKADVANDTAERMHRDWLPIFEKTLALPQKGARTESPRHTMEPLGRLDRFLTPSAADALRGLTHRYYPHPDGWGEWPGSVPAPPERLRAIVGELDAIDRDDQARAYGPIY